MIRLLVIAALLPCGETEVTAPEPEATQGLEVQPVQTEVPSTERLAQLEQQCRSSIPATTFQDAASALSTVRAAIGQLCSIELVGDTPLQWRVSCGSDDFFASGQHEFGETTACTGGSNAFECLGHGLRSMTRHLQHVDVAVVGHVDLQLPRNARLRCDDLSREGWAAPPWTGRVRASRQRANERLAWCRAARAASSIQTGLGDGPLRVAAVGAAGRWLQGQMNPTDESAQCPEPRSEDDEATEGKCQSARRVDVLIRLQATPGRATTECDRAGNTPADVLYCLEQCVSRPEASQSALQNPSDFLRNRGTQTLPSEWHIAHSSGAPGVDLRAVLSRLNLSGL